MVRIKYTPEQIILYILSKRAPFRGVGLLMHAQPI